jgi:DNA-binding GntR family transcriptional regulator
MRFDALLDESARSASEEVTPSYRRIANELRLMILGNELLPGTWIRIQAMADRFGVSVQPVREALHLLHGEGLLELHPNRGAQVRGLDRARLLNIYEIRGAMESFMARRFAEHAGLTDVRALEAIQALHDAALDADDRSEVKRTNGLFHGYINKHSDNPDALEIIRRYHDLTWSIRSRIGFSDVYPDRVRREHHALLDAFRRHDGPAAAEIGLRHVLATLDDLLLQLDRTRVLRID